MKGESLGLLRWFMRWCQEALVENGERVKEVGERNNNIK